MSASTNNRNWTLRPLALAPTQTFNMQGVGAWPLAAGGTSMLHHVATQPEVTPPVAKHKAHTRNQHKQKHRHQPQPSSERPAPQPQSRPHAPPATSTPASSPSPHQHHHHQHGHRPILSFASSFLSFAAALLYLPQSPPPFQSEPPSSSTPNLEPTSANALTPRRRQRSSASNHHRVLSSCSLVSGRFIPPNPRRISRHDTSPSSTTTTTSSKRHPFHFLQTNYVPFVSNSAFVGFPHRASVFHWSFQFALPGFASEAKIVPDPYIARHDVAICLRQRLSSPPPRKAITDCQTIAPPERLLLDYDILSRRTTSQNNDTFSRCMTEQDHVFRPEQVPDQVTIAITPITTPSPFPAMNDPPQLLRPTRQLSSHSPTRHRHTNSVSDDFLIQLAPHSAVDALTSATGSLRACLDGASASERDFTMRTAVASKLIWSWVQELSEWSWPREGGSAGFEAPDGRRRKLAVRVTGPEEDEKEQEYIGSLRAEDVAQYEARIETIHRDMLELEVEDIKSHVLSDHILPLSRPTTPVSGVRRSSTLMSIGSYNKMEDLSAAITAIVIQTLPNLAKLSRLLQVWSTRLRVLQQVPRLLLAIEDAEVALLSGWNAIAAPAKMAQQQPGIMSQNACLSRAHFTVMRNVIEKKVTTGGRVADHMLDCLEGQADTLPDVWLDRLEKVEQDYVEWVAACERRVQETEWVEDSQNKTAEKTASEDGVRPERAQRQAASEKGFMEEPAAETALTIGMNGTKGLETPSDVKDVEQIAKVAKPEVDGFSDLREVLETHSDQVVSGLDGVAGDFATPSLGPPLPIVALTEVDTEANGRPIDKEASLDEDSAYPDLDDDIDLPPLRSDSRRNSDASQTSTVLHGASSHFGGSDMPEISASPDIVRTQIREAEYISTSPPSSPPLAQDDEPGKKAKPADISVIGTVPEDEGIPHTPLDESFVDDYDDSFSVSEAVAGSPSKRRESSGDIQLRQQISQIIESIPAKIKLTNETPNVNLNPPDLQLPKMRKKPSIDRFKRSGSALSTVSSRSGTPAFTLSPAKNARPSRAQRGQQEIKVYHLSRSTGEAPIKLFIRCVGENGERVMVRVGGGWADLSEYLKEYASHHKRRSAAADGPKVEVRDVPRVASGRATAIGSSPPSRPGSALDSPLTPLNVRKPRRSSGAFGSEAPRLVPRTPAAAAGADDSLGAIPQSEDSIRSRSSSRLSWVEEDSSFLGLAGPSGKRVEMSEENKAWVESVKEKVRLASGERRVPPLGASNATPDELSNGKGRFGELGKVGGTKRLFRKTEDLRKK